jgi:hypothetical protein
VSNIIRQYVDHKDFAAYMALSFITFFQVILVPFFNHCKSCLLLFDFVNYVFLCLCLCLYILVMYVIFSLCCSVYCLCANVYYAPATG